METDVTVRNLCPKCWGPIYYNHEGLTYCECGHVTNDPATWKVTPELEKVWIEKGRPLP